ncbi:hypothetical protein [Nocardioides sp. W7]|uniref:hypothetical protein n=1 Tax=Nocardioides sp. W7 TaxID=2931390 RepID=UPI001FD19F48|nr:hypothetical protein [Nocardioides sp. W7]
MTNSPGAKRRHLASSPFKPDPEPVIEDFAVGDRVSHDRHGLGRVIAVHASGVTVDFGDQTLHLRSPFPGMSTL